MRWLPNVLIHRSVDDTHSQLNSPGCSGIALVYVFGQHVMVRDDRRELVHQVGSKIADQRLAEGARSSQHPQRIPRLQHESNGPN